MKSPPRQLWPPQWYLFSLQVMTWRKHKVPKIKKILPYEMKILVPNSSCLQNPWLGGYRPQIPILSLLCPQLNLLKPPPEKKSWLRHCTESLPTCQSLDHLEPEYGAVFCLFMWHYSCESKHSKNIQSCTFLPSQHAQLSVSSFTPTPPLSAWRTQEQRAALTFRNLASYI